MNLTTARRACFAGVIVAMFGQGFVDDVAYELLLAWVAFAFAIAAGVVVWLERKQRKSKEKALT